MNAYFETSQFLETGIVSAERLRLYTGILGQIGDIVMFTATVRRLRELFPNSEITFAVSARYHEAGELIAGLPYVDRLFVTELYFEKLTDALQVPWHLGWPVELRGDDEVEEQRRHDIVFETRPRHRRMPWWNFAHQVAESAHSVGVPGPIDLSTDISIPPNVSPPSDAVGQIVLHNDPSVSEAKVWPWSLAKEFVRLVGPANVVLVGRPGPKVPGTLDLRGLTTLVQTAAIIRSAKCFVGIDSGPMWISGSLRVPTVGLYASLSLPAYEAIHPHNPNAIYLQVEGSLDQIGPHDVVQSMHRLLARS